MLLEITPLDEAGGFVLKGEIDLSVKEQLESALNEAVGTGGAVSLDLSQVTFMDSTGLRVFLVAAAALNGQGPIVLLRPSPAVRRLFDVAIPSGAPGLEIRD